MSLTRKLLESMGLESDKVSTIIEAHLETVDALKDKLTTAEATADALAKAEADLKTTKEELEKLKTGEDWEERYNSEHKAFEDYKNEQSAKDLVAQKETLYKQLLTEAGISEKRIGAIMKVTNLSEFEIEDGALKGADQIKDNITTEWSDFVVATDTSGANTPLPPTNSNDDVDLSSLSMAEYIKARKK